jgi:RHS repeat-associated protein
LLRRRELERLGLRGIADRPAVNRLTQVESSVSSTLYNYSALGQVAGSTQTTGGSSYAPQGAIASVPRGDTLTETRSYNARLQTSGVTLGSVLSLGYSYPPTANNGSVSSISISGAGLASPVTQTFTYDGFNRLTQFSEGGGVSQTYSYDNYGNWSVSGPINPSYSAQTPQTGTTFSNNRWAPDSGGVTYDAAGNQLSVYLGSNATRSFTYDGEGRVLTATIPGMSSGGCAGAASSCYAYDGNGARVQKTVGSTVTMYIYDALGRLAQEAGGPASPYLGETTYLTSDALGSIRAVTSGAPGSLGTPLARYDYAPFGEELDSGMDGRSSPFLSNQYPVPTPDGTEPKFTQQIRDYETGLDFFNARYTSFSQGRFTSPDPLGNLVADPRFPQSWNSYTLNNPLSYMDPSGLSCIDSSGNIVGDNDPSAIGDNGDGEGCTAVGVSAGDVNDPDTIEPYTEQVTAQQGSWLDYLWANLFSYIPGPAQNDVPLGEMGQAVAHQLSNIVGTYPTVCGGGAYLYLGKELGVGPAHGFAGAIAELDTRAGFAKGALFELGGGEGYVGGVGYAGTVSVNGQPASSGLVYGGLGASTPLASASAGLVGFGSGGQASGTGVYGEGFLFRRGGGVGAYLNITNVSRCQ